MATIVERTHVSASHLAREWGVSPRKITAFICAGELTAVNIATSSERRPRYMIARADIDDFLAARRVVPDGGVSTTQRLRRRAQGGGVKEFV